MRLEPWILQKIEGIFLIFKAARISNFRPFLWVLKYQCCRKVKGDFHVCMRCRCIFARGYAIRIDESTSDVTADDGREISRTPITKGILWWGSVVIRADSASRTQEHEEHLRKGMVCISGHRLTVKIINREIARLQVRILGHTVYYKRVSVDLYNILAVIEAPITTNKTKRRRFLRLAGY